MQRVVRILRQGSPTYDPRPGTGPWRIGHQAVGIAGDTLPRSSTTAWPLAVLFAHAQVR